MNQTCNRTLSPYYSYNPQGEQYAQYCHYQSSIIHGLATLLMYGNKSPLQMSSTSVPTGIKFIYNDMTDWIEFPRSLSPHHPPGSCHLDQNTQSSYPVHQADTVNIATLNSKRLAYEIISDHHTLTTQN